MSELGKAGAAKRVAALSPQRRSEIARVAGLRRQAIARERKLSGQAGTHSADTKL